MHFDQLRRRELFSLLGSAAAAWSGAARAQPGERIRRIGILLPVAADDAEFQARVGAFLQGLQQLGWSIGRNVGIDTRWAGARAAEIRRHAAELVALAPDVILAHGVPTLGPLLEATRTLPIVFPTAADPVAAGFVDSLARPGGNATGFMDLEYGMAGKWLELLKQIASGVTRAAVLRDPATPTGPAQFGVIQVIARRKLIALFGGAAAAWPLAARAQQAAMPVIGFLNSRAPSDATFELAGFRRAKPCRPSERRE
jgi:putative ABC transport system substrate-binding protein